LEVKWALSKIWGGKEMGLCKRGNEHYAAVEPVRTGHFAHILKI
jgi:hypothetical protein